jgi:hypothetical protein
MLQSDAIKTVEKYESVAKHNVKIQNEYAVGEEGIDYVV